MTDIVVAPLRQINLVNLSLLPTREIFSARLIAAWVSVAIVLLAFVAGWAVIETRNVSREVSRTAANQAAERARTAPVESDGEALLSPQQLAAREQALRNSLALLEARRLVRDTLKRGVANEKGGPSALMRLIASSLPPQAWVTEFRVSGAQIEFSGKTLDPVAVNVWLDRLRASGFIEVKPLPALRIERVDLPPPSPAPAQTVYAFAISAALSSPFADDGGRP